MKLKEKLDVDIKAFFRDIEKMLPEGREKALRILIDKYCHLSSATVLFDKSDFDNIKSHATREFIDKAFPKKFRNSYREITSGESANYCLIKSTISYLYSKDCLKKLPKFDIEGE